MAFGLIIEERRRWIEGRWGGMEERKEFSSE